MCQSTFSLAAIILVTLPCTNASMFNSQPQFTIKAVKNKVFDESCLIGTFNISSGNIADCLEHCLGNCRCQSFQICEKTKCELCSSHKDENSSLLYDKDGCVYATYEMRHSTENFQKLDDQCSGMSCSMKYNCCQQSGLCPETKACKPFNSTKKPWKRFTCECQKGYHGDNCEPITSCQGYSQGSRMSGMYKVVDSSGSVYEVYCHFDSDGAWTLVQSYSFAHGTYGIKLVPEFRKSLSGSHPVSENAPTWSGYRLSKPRMESIENNSTLLQFTCDYEKHRDIKKSDYVQIRLGSIKVIKVGEGEKVVSILELIGRTSSFPIGEGRGKVGKYNLNECKIKLHQDASKPYPLHVHVDETVSACKFNSLSCSGYRHDYFGSYISNDCSKNVHRCAQDDHSTTQLWFGMREGSPLQPTPGDTETTFR